MRIYNFQRATTKFKKVSNQDSKFEETHTREKERERNTQLVSIRQQRFQNVVYNSPVDFIPPNFQTRRDSNNTSLKRLLSASINSALTSRTPFL